MHGVAMSRLGPRVRAAAAVALTVLLIGGVPLSTVRAQTPDPSDVVLVLDFSASILQEPADRNRFAAALERIADRVEETSADLVAGDTRITVIQFAARAASYQGCADLKLLANPQAVARFARCLRLVANAYRKGLQPALTRRIGVDTNYVAAMETAAAHLPADAVRPAMILFTDGRHDVPGVPANQVRPARDRLFGSRAPFALLPVGMGLDPAQRDALEAGLVGLRIVRDMPPCVTGETFDWPEVVFDSADKAGNAVAVALQNATCTFTVEPTPTPVPLPGAVQDIRLTARDSAIVLTWSPPVTTSAPVVGYRARCQAGDGEWIEAKEAVSLNTTATVEGLKNGTEYRCEVAALGAAASGMWTAATTAVTPMAPAPPTAEPTPVPEAIPPCGSLLECNPLVQPLLGILLAVALGFGLLALFLAFYRGRSRGYVVAVVDGIYSANLGQGSRLGIRFVRDPNTRRVTEIVGDRSSNADIRIRHLRGDRFAVTDRVGRRVAASGETVPVVAAGGRHALELQAFTTNPASAASTRS
jgi:Fibronectin type III domain